MSATTRDPLAVRSAPAERFTVKRLLKVGIACGVLTAGVYAIWSVQGFVGTDNAVVSAYVTSLRAPIEGFVAASHTQVGSEIGRGEILARVTTTGRRPTPRHTAGARASFGPGKGRDHPSAGHA